SDTALPSNTPQDSPHDHRNNVSTKPGEAQKGVAVLAAAGGGDLVGDDEPGAAHDPVDVDTLEGAVVDDCLDPVVGSAGADVSDEADGGGCFRARFGYSVDGEHDPAVGLVGAGGKGDEVVSVD